ncbi:hypothetical protein [Streptomyces sp. NPDC058457]|uniref:hypothetical protein n=1 Tax=Streptomyces sp. NPDC058457 TaxID=3346507 RepID=UPI00365BCEF9
MAYSNAATFLMFGIEGGEYTAELWEGRSVVEPGDRVIFVEDKVLEVTQPLTTNRFTFPPDPVPVPPASTVGFKLRRSGFPGAMFKSGHLAELPPEPAPGTTAIEILEAPWVFLSAEDVRAAIERGLGTPAGSPPGTPVSAPPWPLPGHPSYLVDLVLVSINDGSLRIEVRGQKGTDILGRLMWRWEGDVTVAPNDRMIRAAGAEGPPVRQPILSIHAETVTLVLDSIGPSAAETEAILAVVRPIIAPMVAGWVTAGVNANIDTAALSQAGTVLGSLGGMTAVPLSVGVAVENVLIGNRRAEAGADPTRGVHVLPAIGTVGSLRAALGLPQPTLSGGGCRRFLPGAGLIALMLERRGYVIDEPGRW